MYDTLMITVIVALVLSSIFEYLNHRKSKQELQEYRKLFELADTSQKTTQVKVEELLQDMSRKDVLLDRSAHAIESANIQSAMFAEEISSLKSQVTFQEEQYNKLFGQKKSSETRLGQISEQIAPFLAGYPFDPKRSKFIGDPIDIVSFGDDKITFVEIKSGRSQLSKKQRQIRDMVKEGKVDFFVYRIKGE
jgi:predicted Holliday junction resolvase-like endonuclease